MIFDNVKVLYLVQRGLLIKFLPETFTNMLYALLLICCAC